MLKSTIEYSLADKHYVRIDKMIACLTTKTDEPMAKGYQSITCSV